MSDPTEIRFCRQCEKQLYGRADQVYCNDTCRNTFNKLQERKAKTPPHPKEKEIFAIIRRNYDILKRLTPKGIHPGHELTIPLEKVPVQFKKNFFTGTTETREGIWYLCFDRGWQMSIETIKLRDFQIFL